MLVAFNVWLVAISGLLVAISRRIVATITIHHYQLLLICLEVVVYNLMGSSNPLAGIHWDYHWALLHRLWLVVGTLQRRL